MNVPCSGLLPSIEVGYPMLFEKVEKRRIINIYFKTNTVDVGDCIQPQQHWPKQHSKLVTPRERLISIMQFFAKMFRHLHHLPMKSQIYEISNLIAKYFMYFC